MNLPQMRALVKKELEHIPSGPIAQNMLRMNFWLSRMNSLGKKAEGPTDAFGVLQQCIKDVRMYHPDFVPRYDRVFFEGSSVHRCKITPKSLDANHHSVMDVGRQLLRLRNDEAGRVGIIKFEGGAAFHEKILDLINGNDSRPAYVPFDREDYAPAQLAELLRKYFPRSKVQDVTIDGQSIYGNWESSR
jgi:hypothetical protein